MINNLLLLRKGGHNLQSVLLFQVVQVLKIAKEGIKKFNPQLYFAQTNEISTLSPFCFLAQQRKQIRLKLTLKLELVVGYYKYKHPYQTSVHGHLKSERENNYKNVKPAYCTSWFTFWSISQTESQLGSTLEFWKFLELSELFTFWEWGSSDYNDWSKMYFHKCYI